MTVLEEELATVRMCGALRDVSLHDLQDPFTLARIVRAAVKREIIRRELNTKKEKDK